MKKLMFAVLLAVVPSALRAQFASLENVANEMKAAETASVANSYGLTAVPFDGALKKESRDSVVAADSCSMESDKKNVPLVENGKMNLNASIPGIPKKAGLGVVEAPKPEKTIKPSFLGNKAAEFDLSTSIVITAYIAMFVWLAMAFISLLV